MRDDSYCNVLCQTHYSKDEVETFKKSINEGYHHNWIIDNLPAARYLLELWDHPPAPPPPDLQSIHRSSIPPTRPFHLDPPTLA